MKNCTSSSEGPEEELVEAEAELRPESCAAPSSGSSPLFQGLLLESRVFQGPSCVGSPWLGSNTSLYTSQAITWEEDDLGGRVSGGGGGEGGRDGGSNTL